MALPAASIPLNNGQSIPQFGFGTYLIDPTETQAAVARALEIGYRHIDTAQMYGNEAGVGAGVRASDVDRADVFVTSKLNNQFHDPAAVRPAFERTMAELDLGYVDLFLIHWPLPGIDIDYVDTWRALEDLLDSGDVRAIGVSNFNDQHLQRVIEAGSVVPAINQIEIHPYLTQNKLRAVNRGYGIATEAWSPLARGAIAQDPVIADLASQLGRAPAQVVLRWHLQRGDIVFPKSSSPDRMAETQPCSTSPSTTTSWRRSTA